MANKLEHAARFAFGFLAKAAGGEELTSILKEMTDDERAVQNENFAKGNANFPKRQNKKADTCETEGCVRGPNHDGLCVIKGPSERP